MANKPYFPLDIHLDEKMELMEAQFGIKAFGVIVKLWQKIYGSEGYYIEWTKDKEALFAMKIGVNKGAVSEIVKTALDKGIFDKNMYKKYTILTSKGIQKRYFNMLKRHKEVTLKKQYLLVDVTQILKNVSISLENVNIQGKNVNNSKQIRLDKIRLDKIRKDNICPDKQDNLSLRHKYGEYKNVLLSDDELSKLKNEFPNDWEERIEDLSEYMTSSGKKYKNHLATIRSWAKRESKAKETISQSRSKFNNYNDTNRHDYGKLQQELIEQMLEEGVKQ